MSEQTNKLLTPCEQLGYKVGDKFIVTEYCHTFKNGTIIELFKDDGTSIPLFKGKTREGNSICNGEDGAFANLSQVTPYKESNTVQKENKMTEQTREPKNKPKTQSQLVFTYTNGKKYVVRGLQQAFVEVANGAVLVTYTHQTKNDVKTQSSTVVVKATNELVKVEKINTDNSVEVVLDLSSNSVKAIEVVGSPHEQSSRHSRKGSKKPRGNARSKEEYEAMLKAKKVTSERNKALVESKAHEIAEKMLKEGKI